MARGGIRPGSGRPFKKADAKRDTLTCRVDPDVRAWLVTEKDRTGKSVGELVDYAVETLQDSPGRRLPDAPKYE